MGILEELYVRPIIVDDDIFGDEAIMPDETEEEPAEKSLVLKDFVETDHPRDDGGKFGSGGGGGTTTAKEPAKEGEKEPAKGTEPTAKDRGALEKLYGGAKGIVDGAKAAAAKVGQAVFDKLPRPVQAALSVSYAGVKWCEHQLEKPYHAAQALVKQVCEERGLSSAHADRVARITSIVDTVGRWTGNVPGAHAAIHALEIATGGTGLALSKAAYYVPVGSLAYLGYSTAKNPLATVRAVRKLIAGKLKKEGTHGH